MTKLDSGRTGLVIECKYCGRPLRTVQNYGYEGMVKDFLRIWEQRIDEESKKCPCRKDMEEVFIS